MIHSGEVVSYLKMVPHKFISPVSWTDSMWHLGGCMVFRYSGKKNHSKRIKGRVKEKEVNSYLSYLTSLFTDIYSYCSTQTPFLRQREDALLLSFR